jgi:hypothetical protein
MPSKVYWYLPKRIIVNEHIGDISIETLVKAVEVTLQMAQGLDTPFYLIADASQLAGTPKDIGQGLMNNENLEAVFVISANPLHKFIGNMVVQLLRKSSQVVGTMAEALIALEELDKSLASLADIKPALDEAVLIE